MPRILPALAAGLLAFLAAAPVLAQSAPAAKKPRLYYDHYEASHRLRLRRDTCMHDEDLIAQYCAKKCEAGYVVDNPGKVPRECRSEKPLPEGQLPQGGRKQRGVVTVPPKPVSPTPGA